MWTKKINKSYLPLSETIYTTLEIAMKLRIKLLVPFPYTLLYTLKNPACHVFGIKSNFILASCLLCYFSCPGRCVLKIASNKPVLRTSFSLSLGLKSAEGTKLSEGCVILGDIL